MKSTLLALFLSTVSVSSYVQKNIKLAAPNGKHELVASDEADVGNAPFDGVSFSFSGDPAGNGGPLLAGSGAVLSEPTLYTQFYGTGDSWTAANVVIYTDFMTNVGASSYMASTRGSPFGAQGVKFGGHRIVNGGKGHKDLSSVAYSQNVIDGQVTLFAPTVDTQGIYALVVDQEKSQYMKTTPGNRYGVKWCGYHSVNSHGASQYTYAVVGTGGACTWDVGKKFWSVNGNDVDYSISVLAHQIQSTVTDPWLNSWKDAEGKENGDKCSAWPGVASLVNGPGSEGPIFNAEIGESQYLIQTHYDQVTNTCPKKIWKN